MLPLEFGHQPTKVEDQLRQENASLRRALVNHPATETLRFVAPFIRDAIAADTWKAGMGTKAVEREIASALSWLDRYESTHCDDVCEDGCIGVCGVGPRTPEEAVL